ncbi:cGMP-specific 3',5'-cyclic phosphodiesterase-like isoform X2 [Dendronephthya gigantea]|nr:cGMP-specific 3',5'-cyclic phosphodiesterase-like isoform X2 [Dendronephthya gigantea]
MEYRRNQVLLQLAKRIFEEQTSLDKVVHNIMLESQELLHCERCSVSLVDSSVENEIVFSKSFNLLPEGAKDECSASDNHWSLSNGIAKFAATSGETINISDAYQDDRFSEKVKESDAVTGFHTKSVLCTPIKRNQQTIGVCQLINKTDGRPFDENDESLFEGFAIFCGIGIHNTNMYEKTSKLLAKQMVAMEVLSYHARAAPEDVKRLMNSPVLHSDEFKLHDFSFSDFQLSDDETIQASLRMFLDLNILDRFHISSKTFISWLLSVKKNYRPVIYHNWRHAFNVTQTMFVMLTTGTMRKHFSDLEAFALLVACLCHDLDHRGTNNTFQSKIESPLAQLYGTSTMEHHHFDHCIMILNSEGNNIFSELPPDDYRKAIEYLEHAILSTDLQIYFKKRDHFTKILEEDEQPEWGRNDQNRSILRAMMMTACDVSAITKPWPIQQTVAKLVASEFFEQGDIERDKLKSEPMPMMDRKKKDDLPKMQVGFIDAICLPIYKLMAMMEPNLSPLLDGVTSNRQNWQALADDVTHNVEETTDSLDGLTTSQQKEIPEINNNSQRQGNSELLDEETPHHNNTNLALETKSFSPRSSCVEITAENPKGSKNVVNDSKKKKSSKTTSKTCCLL